MHKFKQERKEVRQGQLAMIVYLKKPFYNELVQAALKNDRQLSEQVRYYLAKGIKEDVHHE